MEKSEGISTAVSQLKQLIAQKNEGQKNVDLVEKTPCDQVPQNNLYARFNRAFEKVIGNEENQDNAENSLRKTHKIQLILKPVIEAVKAEYKAQIEDLQANSPESLRIELETMTDKVQKLEAQVLELQGINSGIRTDMQNVDSETFMQILYSNIQELTLKQLANFNSKYNRIFARKEEIEETKKQMGMISGRMLTESAAFMNATMKGVIANQEYLQAQIEDLKDAQVINEKFQLIVEKSLIFQAEQNEKFQQEISLLPTLDHLKELEMKTEKMMSTMSKGSDVGALLLELKEFKSEMQGLVNSQISQISETLNGKTDQEERWAQMKDTLEKVHAKVDVNSQNRDLYKTRIQDLESKVGLMATNVDFQNLSKIVQTKAENKEIQEFIHQSKTSQKQQEKFFYKMKYDFEQHEEIIKRFDQIICEKASKVSLDVLRQDINEQIGKIQFQELTFGNLGSKGQGQQSQKSLGDQIQDYMDQKFVTFMSSVSDTVTTQIDERVDPNLKTQIKHLQQTKFTFSDYEQDVEKRLNEINTEAIIKKVAEFQKRLYDTIVVLNETAKLHIQRADETVQVRQNRIQHLVFQSYALASTLTSGDTIQQISKDRSDGYESMDELFTSSPRNDLRNEFTSSGLTMIPLLAQTHKAMPYSQTVKRNLTQQRLRKEKDVGSLTQRKSLLSQDTFKFEPSKLEPVPNPVISSNNQSLSYEPSLMYQSMMGTTKICSKPKLSGLDEKFIQKIKSQTDQLTPKTAPYDKFRKNNKRFTLNLQVLE